MRPKGNLVDSSIHRLVSPHLFLAWRSSMVCMRWLRVGAGLMPNTRTPLRTLPPPRPWVKAIKPALAVEPQM